MKKFTIPFTVCQLKNFIVQKKAQESFVICGSNNWDYYCTDKGQNKEFDEFKNVALIGFDTIDEVNAFRIEKEQIIDFSREHISEVGVQKYFLLVQQ